jgi:hypothetical protein
MAKKKAPKKKSTNTKKVRSRRAGREKREGQADAVLDVQLGSMSVGKTTAGIGFKIDKEKIGLQAAFELLVGARLDVEIETGQEPLFDGAIPSLASVADVHKLSIGTDGYSGKLTFRRDDTDLESLSEIVSKSAQITFRRIGASGAEEDQKDVDKDDATPAELDQEPLQAPQE